MLGRRRAALERRARGTFETSASMCTWIVPLPVHLGDQPVSNGLCQDCPPHIHAAYRDEAPCGRGLLVHRRVKRPRCRGPFSWHARRLGSRSICPPNCESSRRDRRHGSRTQMKSWVSTTRVTQEKSTATMTMTQEKSTTLKRMTTSVVKARSDE